MNTKVYKYHYFYKITNIVTGQYYFGIHSTNNINDNYMGSGTLLKREYVKYGKDKFAKDILKFFDCREDLIQYEQDIITEDILKDPLCLNVIRGGIAGLEKGFTIGMATVRDKSGNCFDVKVSDPRYISGELVPATKHRVTVRDKFGKSFKVYVNDPRYISGELVIVSKGNKAGTGRTHIVKGDECKFILKEELQQYLDDGWEKRGKSRNCGKVTVFDESANKYIQVDKTDPRYLSGELKSKFQIKNGYTRGTIYINKNGKIKRINPQKLQEYTDDGWVIGMKS